MQEGQASSAQLILLQRPMVIIQMLVLLNAHKVQLRVDRIFRVVAYKSLLQRMRCLQPQARNLRPANTNIQIKDTITSKR